MLTFFSPGHTPFKYSYFCVLGDYLLKSLADKKKISIEYLHQFEYISKELARMVAKLW